MITEFYALNVRLPEGPARYFPELDPKGWVTIRLEHEQEIKDGTDLVRLELQAHRIARAILGDDLYVTANFSRPDFPAGQRMVIEKTGPDIYEITERAPVPMAALAHVLAKPSPFAEDDEETVTIPREEYEELKEDAAFLGRLRAAGVDNWDGFEHAFG